MKKVFAIVLAMMLVLSAAAMAETVKIGVFEPASGDSGAGGKQEMLGMQYANKETPTVEIGGTTYDVELVYADNGSSTDKAPSAAQALVAEGVSVVLGSYGSGVSIAGSQYFADAGIPAIGVTCTNPQVT
ncbi:MAG: ABC transporter substrate-binding protein, partial [Clostridia bacterium]|nr:ABC transporter substrate-binding protein [Clostridia bacterium]